MSFISNRFYVGVGVIVSAALAAGSARADLRPDSVHPAQPRKMGVYLRDGVIAGGDQTVNQVIVRDIRRATNAGYERIVIDLEGNHDGQPVAISRAPYYQVSVNPDEKRLIFTVWGKPKLAFDSKKVLAAFRKSAAIKSVQLLPSLEVNSWTFAAELRGANPIEVFELSSPVRIIIDIKNVAAAKAEGE